MVSLGQNIKLKTYRGVMNLTSFDSTPSHKIGWGFLWFEVPSSLW